jgi:hypothetical protein
MLTKKTQIEDESKNLNLKSKEIKVWIFFKKVLFLSQFDVFSIIVESFSKNSTMTLGFKGPSHPTWTSLN